MVHRFLLDSIPLGGLSGTPCLRQMTNFSGISDLFSASRCESPPPGHPQVLGPQVPGHPHSMGPPGRCRVAAACVWRPQVSPGDFILLAAPPNSDSTAAPFSEFFGAQPNASQKRRQSFWDVSPTHVRLTRPQQGPCPLCLTRVRHLSAPGRAGQGRAWPTRAGQGRTGQDSTGQWPARAGQRTGSGRALAGAERAGAGQ